MEFQHYQGDRLVEAGLVFSVILTMIFIVRMFKEVHYIWLVGFFASTLVIFWVKTLHNSLLIVEYPHWLFIDYPFRYLRPLFLYFFVLQSAQVPFKALSLLHFVLPIGGSTLILPDVFMTSDLKIHQLNNDLLLLTGHSPAYLAIYEYALNCFYLISILYTINRFRQKYESPSRTQRRTIFFLRFIGISMVVFLGILVFLWIVGYSSQFNFYSYEIFSVFLFTFIVLLSAKSQWGIESYNGKSLNSKTDQVVSGELFASIQNQGDLFLQCGFKLFDLSKEVNASPNTVSQVIKSNTGQNFRDFVNTHRIEEAKKRLLSDSDKLTIEAIATEVGFNSRTSFYKAFQKNTGLTPKEYLTQTLSK